MDHFFASRNKPWSITAQNDLHIVYTLINSYTWLYTDTRDLLYKSREISAVHYVSAGRRRPCAAKPAVTLLTPWPGSPTFWDAHMHSSCQLQPQLLEVLFSRRRKNIARFSSLPWQHPPSNTVRYTPPWVCLEIQNHNIKSIFYCSLNTN